MEATKTTSKKRNHIRISEIIQQIIYKNIMEAILPENRIEHVKAHYAKRSKSITSDIMSESKIDIILKRGKKC